MDEQRLKGKGVEIMTRTGLEVDHRLRLCCIHTSGSIKGVVAAGVEVV